MAKNTSISLSSHFEQMIQNLVNEGRYNNASEVVRAALRLLEIEEQRLITLRNALEKGFESGIAEDFDPETFLQTLKFRRANGEI